jgi:hypothetical protein
MLLDGDRTVIEERPITSEVDVIEPTDPRPSTERSATGAGDLDRALSLDGAVIEETVDVLLDGSRQPEQREESATTEVSLRVQPITVISIRAPQPSRSRPITPTSST